MPYAAGVYAAPSNSWNPAVAATAINATDWAALLADLTTALSTAVLKDGTQALTANIPMGGFKLTGLVGGTAAGDSVRWEQLAASLTAAQWAVAAGTVSAITAAYSPVNASLTDGLILGFRSSGANTSTTPTFAPDGLTAHTITKIGGTALLVGDLPPSLGEVLVRYNLANTRWELLNPVVGTTGSFTITLTGCTATITGTAYYSITNNMVTLDLPALTGTSNTTAATLTGLPAALQPASVKLFPLSVQNNGTVAEQVGTLSAGTITLYVSFNATGFTNSAAKGIGGALSSGGSITYTLN